jgi:type I restriction enzyme S subunit
LNRHNYHTGDIVLTKLGDPLGKACIIPDSFRNGIIVADLVRLRLRHEYVSKKWLMLAINAPKIADQLKLLTKGTTRPRVNLGHVRSAIVDLPPLEEQRRIVAKIEELLSELDKGVESLTTVREQFKVYRQALLKHAFEGKLTEQWRAEHADQLETADQLLARIKKEREKRYQEQLAEWEKGVKDGEKPQNPIKPRNYPRIDENELEKLPAIPDGWRWIKSGNLFMSVTSGSRGWAKYYSDHGAIFVRITNLNFDTLELDLRPEKVQHVKPPEGAEGVRTKIQEGDFLFSITGYLGMFAIAPKLEEAYVNQHIALARPVGIFNKEYVGYYFSSRTGGIHQFNKLTKGAVKAGLGLEDINTVSVPMCSVLEQEMIVELIEERLSVIVKLEQDILLNIDRISAMRQSILKKAFSGELVPQDPNDEPASELLARIKAEREDAQQQAKKIPRKAKKKKEVITMADLMEVMQTAKDWMSAQEAFRKCGIADGAETDAIEKIYEELRGYVKENKIAVERRGEEDWLRLAQGA